MLGKSAFKTTLMPKLWVEIEVEKEISVSNKKILEYSLDKFTEKCIDRINKFSQSLPNSQKAGAWMDWGNSYYTNTT